MNIIVSAGHGDRDPGAVYGSTVEHLHAYPIAWLLRSELEAKGHTVEFISCFQPLSAKIRTVNECHNRKPVALAIEIHFNSAVDFTANGTEVLHYSPNIGALAAKISAALSGAIGTRDRGAKHRTDLGWLKQTQPPAMIVEVCFISGTVDRAWMAHADFHQNAADAIAAAL